jgi:hypothetical protein
LINDNITSAMKLVNPRRISNKLNAGRMGLTWVGPLWLHHVVRLQNHAGPVVYEIPSAIKSDDNCVATLINNTEQTVLVAVSGWNTIREFEHQLANHDWTLHVRQMCEDMLYRLRLCPDKDCGNYYYYASHVEMQLMAYLYYRQAQDQSFIGQELEAVIKKRPCAECEHFIMHWQNETGLSLSFWVDGKLQELRGDLECTEEICGMKRKGGPLLALKKATRRIHRSKSSADPSTPSASEVSVASLESED